MPLNPTFSTEPKNYSPVFGDLWTQLQSASYSVSNYKYVFDLWKFNPQTFASSKLGRYKVPPSPDTYGLFNPNRILQTQMSYDLQPTITGISSAPNSYIPYQIYCGFEWGANYRFVNTFNSGGYLGLTFSDILDLKVNDLITISKDDRTTNFEYNGQTTITQITSSYSVRTAKLYQASLISAETGTITSQLRITGTSSILYAFNGVRPYEYEAYSYGLNTTYLINGTLPSASTYSLTNYRFCSGLTPEYNNAKVVEYDDWETLSYLVDNTSGGIKSIQVQLWNQSASLIGTFTASYSLSATWRRADLGTGPENLKSLFGASFFSSNPLYYTVSLIGTDPLKPWGVYHYKIKNNDPRANCSPYPKVRLAWVNRLGGIDYYTFNFRSKNTMTAEKTEFKRELPWNYTVGQRQDYILSTKIDEMWQISSDFITENESNWIKELITSPEVYLIKPEGSGITKLPIIITDSNYEVKTYLTDKLFALTINFKYGYPVKVQQS